MPSSLSEHDLIEILRSDASIKELAGDYNVSEGTIRNIKMLKTNAAQDAKDLCESFGWEIYTIEPQKRFNRQTVKAIRASTKTSAALAKKHGVAESTIRMIRTGKTYV